MNALTNLYLYKFLELLDLKTEIDVFCSFRSPYLMQAPQAEKGKACFHLLLSGHCQMQSDKSVHRLQAGDFCLDARQYAQHW